MGALGQGLETAFLIALHPPIDALASHAEGGCHLADGEAVPNDGKYRVVANSEQGVNFGDMVTTTLQLVKQEQAAMKASPTKKPNKK